MFLNIHCSIFMLFSMHASPFLRRVNSPDMTYYFHALTTGIPLTRMNTMI
jgi:hypothetical protein